MALRRLLGCLWPVPVVAVAVAALNRQVHSLAAVMNSPAGGDSAAVESANRDVPVAILPRKHQGATYVFAVAMRDGETTATITLKGSPGASATVIDEDRDLPVKDARLTDRFKGYDVHLYRVKDSR